MENQDSESSTPTTVAGPSVATTKVELSDFMIMPMGFDLKAGNNTFEVTNVGQTPHNFEIRNAGDEVLGKTRDLNAGESETIQVSLNAGEEYSAICEKPGHESLGMKELVKVS